VADDFETLRSLAVLGEGIAFLPSFLCAEEAKQRELVRVLPQWRGDKVTLSARLSRAKVRFPKGPGVYRHGGRNVEKANWLEGCVPVVQSFNRRRCAPPLKPPPSSSPASRRRMKPRAANKRLGSSSLLPPQSLLYETKIEHLARRDLFGHGQTLLSKIDGAAHPAILQVVESAEAAQMEVVNFSGQ